MSDELERYKIKIGLWKFMIGTVVMGVLTVAVNYQIQNREIDLKQKEIDLKDKEILLKDKDIERQELAQLGNYIDHALQENVAIRRRFAQYFATVSSSDSIRERWRNYYELVNNEFTQVTQEVIRLEAEQAKLTAENENNKELKILMAKIEALESELEVRRSIVIEESKNGKTKEDNSNSSQSSNTKKIITAWTSWSSQGSNHVNPCPSGYIRGKLIGQDYRMVGVIPPKPQVKYKYECIEQ